MFITYIINDYIVSLTREWWFRKQRNKCIVNSSNNGSNPSLGVVTVLFSLPHCLCLRGRRERQPRVLTYIQHWSYCSLIAGFFCKLTTVHRLILLLYFAVVCNECWGALKKSVTVARVRGGSRRLGNVGIRYVQAPVLGLGSQGCGGKDCLVCNACNMMTFCNTLYKIGLLFNNLFIIITLHSRWFPYSFYFKKT